MGGAMPDLELKAAKKFIKLFGPTADDKKKFSQTFLGSVIGQSVVFVGMVVVYLLIILVAATYFAPVVEALKDTIGPVLLIVLVVVPPIVILVFSIIPTLLRARSESRLKRAEIAGDVRFRPGYFRLTPYSKVDCGAFKRLDGADDAIFNWLASTQESLLYLSGASGVGKSSIMAAGVVPRLRDLDWTIVETRIFGEPVEQVRRKLLETKGLFTRKLGGEMGLCDLLAHAAESRAKKGAAPLLLIIDQFEEFLILNNKAEQRAPFAAFLEELAAKPIDGLRLLLIYRRDYRALIFKFTLPPPTHGRNWLEIAPYNRGEATEFLQGGGRQFSEAALDALFRGLDRIEEARGIYRLITLNMVGLILERMGQRFDEDPGRLIQSYLLDCLSSGEGHEFAGPLLEHMITDAGTKEPRTEATLVELTGLERWQVTSALTGLGAQGIVRRLEGAEPVWEVSHDFIARIIGRLIGRLKPSLFRRVQPFVAPVILALWIVFIGFFIPGWLSRNVEHRVMNAMSLTNKDGGLAGRPAISDFDDGKLLRLIPDLKALNSLKSFYLVSTHVADIAPLKDLKSLTTLYLNDTQVTDIAPLKDLKSLTTLYLGYTKITDIAPLKDLKSLTILDLGNTQVADIAPLKDLKSLTTLYLNDTQVADIAPLQDLKSLAYLSLVVTKVADIAPLKNLKSLTSLYLSGTTVADIAPLKELTSLIVLDLYGTKVTDITPLKDLKSLTDLDLSQTRVTDIAPLKDLKSLTALHLYGTKVADITPLKDLKSLMDLDLWETKVTTLAPLRGLPIRISADEELKATLK
ncbi:MAG: leucine-rich repeat domain-containing protein [Methylocella sp.]